MGREYAKWNPDDKHVNIVLLNDYEMYSTNDWNSVRATLPKTDGRHYLEFWMTVSETYIAFGVGPRSGPGQNLDYFVGSNNVTDSWGWIDQASAVRYHNSSVAGGMSASNGDIIGMAVDLDNNKLWYSKNGSWAWGSKAGDPANGIGGIDISSRLNNELYIIGSSFTQNYRFVMNSGYTDFSYTVPAGFNEGWYIETYAAFYNGYTYQLNQPVSRIVRLYDEDTGTLQDETTSSGNGYYSLETVVSGSHYIVCLDDSGDYNHLINKGTVSEEVQ